MASTGWWALTAEVLAVAEEGLGDAAATTSFVHLGGTSLRAAELVARARRDLLRHIEITDLLDDRPLDDVLAKASMVEPAPGPDLVAPLGLLPVSAGQTSMLLADEVGVGTAFHLLFSADIRGRLDVPRLRDAISTVVAAHRWLRTVFVHSPDGIGGRVVAEAEPFILHEDLPDLAAAPAAEIQGTVAPRSAALLRPFDRPPVVFVLTRLTDERCVLHLLVHHAVADGWSIGLILRDIVACYQGSSPVDGGRGMLADNEHIGALVEARATELAAFPHRLRLPQPQYRDAEFDRRGLRLAVTLTGAERAACEAIAAACGVTRNAALFAAWTLTLARCSGMTEFLVGLSVAGRTTSEEMATVGLGTKLLPVTCVVPPDESCRVFVRATADQMRRALAHAAVPMEHLVRRLGLGGESECNPLIQVGFSAHDDLVPASLTAPELDVSIVEGHCGGTVFDAMLYVQRWADAPRLTVEYAATAVGPQTAGLLAAGLRRSLVATAAALDGPVRDIGIVTSAQERRLRALGTGPAAGTGTGVWRLVEAAARRAPGAIAVRDDEGELSYAALVRAARWWSAALAASGISPGDCVAVVAARSMAEIVAVLAILRLGAHYLSVEESTPDPVVAQQWAIARPRAVLTEPRRAPAARRLAADIPVLVLPGKPGDLADGEPAGPDPERPAYIAFTSGTTGVSKGVRVPDRAIERLVRDPRFLRIGATDRFMRLAPLAFDASTLEIFAPLAAGGCIEVYPHGPVAPGDLAEFVVDRRVTGLWLTSGLFRVMADHHPDCFRGVKQLLTGGDVVPPRHVANVLAACPGLRVSNGYGPTENTTFTTVHHTDDPSEVEDPLPIGRPIQGGSVLVVDELGGLAPPGAVGELYVAGDGLALDYAYNPADNPAETADRFVWRTDGRRYYRTGDLVSWDARGRLRFVGRLDGQVKIRGFRVELDQIDRVLRRHPDVTDVLVTTFTDGLAERRILAAAVAARGDGLIKELRRYAERELPPYAVPSRWLVLDRIPLTANGKPDHAALVESSTAVSAPWTPATPSEPDMADLENAIAGAWAAVLGTDDFGYSERFFDVGGSSIQLPALRSALRSALGERLPDRSVSMMDLLRHPTVKGLAEHLAVRHGGSP